MLTIRILFILLIACLLTACVHLPAGPGVMTLPGSGKNFDQFRSDEYECRKYADEQAGGTTPRQASRTSGIESAAIGAGLGAAAGAVLGGGHGAAIGAGTGLLLGGLIGSSTATTSGNASQQRYDISYTQCMYAKGHRVPVDGRIMNNPPGNSGIGRRTSARQENFSPLPLTGNPPSPPLR